MYIILCAYMYMHIRWRACGISDCCCCLEHEIYKCLHTQGSWDNWERLTLTSLPFKFRLDRCSLTQMTAWETFPQRLLDFWKTVIAKVTCSKHALLHLSPGETAFSQLWSPIIKDIKQNGDCIINVFLKWSPMTSDISSGVTVGADHYC